MENRGAEFDLLLSACFDQEPRPAWYASAGGLAWEPIGALARRHRVAGLLSDWLSRHRLSPPQRFTSDLLKSCHAQARTYLLQTAETAHLTGGLARLGISSIVLKGVATAERLYRPRSHVRHSVDIDLLVSPDAFRRADDYLRSEGYVRISPDYVLPDSSFSMALLRTNAFEFQKPATGIKVELHHRPLHDPYKMPVGFEALLRRSARLSVGSSEVNALARNDEAVFLCSHGAGHAYFRLKWIADVLRAIRFAEATPDELRSYAGHLNCARDMLATLALLDYLQDGRKRVGGAREGRKVGRLVSLCKRAMLTDCKAGPPKSFALSDLPVYLGELPAVLQSADNFPSVRFLLLARFTSLQDLTFLRLGAGWAWLYFGLGPWLALGRILRRWLLGR